MNEVLEVVDFNSLEEQFGKKFATELKERVEYCNAKGLEYQVKIIEESSYFIKIAFATFAFAYSYEIAKNLKRITNENFIGRNECGKILELLDEMNEKKEKQ